jgi:MarR family transcriptional regulator, organic hydroperoxide resistance regulator
LTSPKREEPPVADTLARDLLDIAWFVRPHGLNDPRCGDLAAAEMRALSTAAAGDCRTLQDIAHSLGVTRSGATRVVDRLELRGLARRCCSSLDRRSTCVELTAAGRAALAAASRRFEVVLDDVLAPLCPYEQRDIRRALDLLADRVRTYRES